MVTAKSATQTENISTFGLKFKFMGTYEKRIYDCLQISGKIGLTKIIINEKAIIIKFK